ncbi:hypothetical protein PAMP_001232 [Pampus punctatissimus]
MQRMRASFGLCLCARLMCMSRPTVHLTYMMMNLWQTGLVIVGCDRHANAVLALSNMLKTRRNTSPSATFQPIAISQLPPEKTSEDLHPLSKPMKVMNKNPNLFYQAQPHPAISQRLTVNALAPIFKSMM